MTIACTRIARANRIGPSIEKCQIQRILRLESGISGPNPPTDPIGWL